MKYLILLLSLFLNQSIYPEGFVAGTLIKTERGFVPIEELKEGDEVISFDLFHAFFARPIINTIKKKTSSLVKITLDDEVIFAAPDQRLLNLSYRGNNFWLTAAEVKANSNLDDHQVKDVETLDVEMDVVTLSVATYGNFIVSEHEICAHNFEPFTCFTACLTAYTTASAIAEFAVGAATAATIVGLGGMAAGSIATQRRHHTRTNERSLYSNNCQNNSDPENNDLSSCCSDGNNPDGPWDPNDPRDPRNKIKSSIKKISDKKQKNSPPKVTIKKELKKVAEQCCELEKKTSNELKKGIRSKERRIAEHQIKLAEYLKNPDKFDNKGHLKNAKTIELREKIIKRRAELLRGEINRLKTEIKEMSDIIKKKVI